MADNPIESLLVLLSTAPISAHIPTSTMLLIVTKVLFVRALVLMSVFFLELLVS